MVNVIEGSILSFYENDISDIILIDLSLVIGRKENFLVFETVIRLGGYIEENLIEIVRVCTMAKV